MILAQRRIDRTLVKLLGSALCAAVCLALIVWFFAHKHEIAVQDDFDAQRAQIYREVATRSAILLGEHALIQSGRAKLAKGPSEQERNQVLNEEKSAAQASAALEESLSTLGQQSEKWPQTQKQEALSMIKEARKAILIVERGLNDLRRDLGRDLGKAILKEVDELKKVSGEQKPKANQ